MQPILLPHPPECQDCRPAPPCLESSYLNEVTTSGAAALQCHSQRVSLEVFGGPHLLLLYHHRQESCLQKTRKQRKDDETHEELGGCLGLVSLSVRKFGNDCVSISLNPLGNFLLLTGKQHITHGSGSKTADVEWLCAPQPSRLFDTEMLWCLSVNGHHPTQD